MAPSPVIIVDCYSIAYRVFYSMGDLLSHNDQQTGVIYGFVTQLLRLAKQFATHHFILCWDSARSIRKLRYPPYKSRREHPVTPDEILSKKAFKRQMRAFRVQWAPMMGFANNVMYTGLEADDCIALVAKYSTMPRVWDTNGSYIIVSTDKDLYQLLAPHVMLYADKQMVTVDDFRAMYGIQPIEWIRAKALGGCRSDSVEGIAGIADPAKSPSSRAIRYLRGALKGTFLQRIESAEGQAIYQRNLKLVTLPYCKLRVPTIVDNTYSVDGFVRCFDALDFRSFLRKDMLAEWITYFSLC